MHAQKKRGSHWSFLSLLLLYLYSVTQCFSLTLVFWTDLSNRLFSFLLSLLHSSLFGIPLFHFKFFLLSLCFYQRLFSPCRTIIFSPCILLSSSSSSSHPASLIWFYMIYHLFACCPCYLHLLHHRSSLPPAISSLYIRDVAAKLGSPCTAWQGTDLMHNHVLADVDRSCMDSPGRRSSVSRPELSSDLSEDSDYDSIWTTHSYRMGSVPRKSCISHQN